MGVIQHLREIAFAGNANENPVGHLQRFLDVCITINILNVTQNSIRLCAFKFYVKDRVMAWYNSLLANSITTWDGLLEAFIRKFLPPRKIAEMRAKITGFTMLPGETLHEAWERFKDLQRQCPMHGQRKEVLLQVFYQGINGIIRDKFDNKITGDFMELALDDAWELIEQMVVRSE